MASRRRRSEDDGAEQSDGDEMTGEGARGDDRGAASPSPSSADSGGTGHISWTERLWPRQPTTTKGAGVRPRTTPVPRSTGSTTRPTSTKKAVERLDDKERRLSLAAAVAAFVLGVGVYLLETHDKVHFTKNPDAPFTSLMLALACGVFLLGSTLIGRRAPVGFVALLAFLIFGTTSFVLGLPFLALAIWLLWHSYKIQKEATARVRESSGQRREHVQRYIPGGGRQDGQDLEGPDQDVVLQGPGVGRGPAGAEQALHTQTSAATSSQTFAAGTEGGPGPRLSRPGRAARGGRDGGGVR